MNIQTYLTYDSPIPYRGLEFYPVRVIDYMIFTLYSQCFLIEKNYTRDISIISMTDLEYLYYATEKDKESFPVLLLFDRILSISLRNDNSFDDVETSMKRYKYDEKGKPFFEISGETYTDKDFCKIKEIICEQNMIELPDFSISKEVRDSLEKAQEYKKKLEGIKSASFEDYIISLSIATGWTTDQIHAMTVRKFIKSIQRLDNLIHYKIYLSASMSGMVEFKDKSFIKHWLTSIEDKDKYADVSLDLNEVKRTISLESAK